ARQMQDGAFWPGDLGDLRRGCSELHGYHGRTIHVLRPLRKDRPKRDLRQLVSHRRCRAQDQRTRRDRQCAPGPVRSRACCIHEARRARACRINAFGEEMPNIENRIELASDKDEFGMSLAKIIHSYDQDAAALWNANFEEGLAVAKAAGAKEMWSSRGNMPTIHLLGG